MLQAEPVIDHDEPFVVILADDLIDSPKDKNCIQQIIDTYQKSPAPDTCVCAIEKVAREQVHKYGIVNPQPQDHSADQVWPITNFVEKPDPDKAISSMAVIGRYVLHAHLFEFLRNTQKSIGGEIQLTDAIHQYAQQHSVLAKRYYGKRYDCGNVLEYLIANIEYGRKHPDIRRHLDAYLKARQQDWHHDSV